MKNQSYFRLAGLIAVLFGSHAAFGQGALTPPGAPAPTMKTLDQVEPRIPITTLPIFLTQPGNYYLAKSFTQNFTSDAISIVTNNITLDFGGFTVQQTGTPSTIVGIRLFSPASLPVNNVIVKNGTITGFASAGISCQGPRNCIFKDLTITECNGGITAQAGTAAMVGNVFQRCQTCDNTGSGISLLSGAANVQNVIDNCISLNNTSAGIAVSCPGSSIMNCIASGNANNYVIAAGNRGGIFVLPTANASGFSGSTGGSGTGTTDPYANLSY